MRTIALFLLTCAFAGTAFLVAAQRVYATSTPEIYDVAFSERGGYADTISWKTDIATTGIVDYGTAAGQYTDRAESATLGLSHAVAFVVIGLKSGTTYYFRITATASDGTTASKEKSFTTKPDVVPARTIRNVQSVAVGPNTVVLEVETKGLGSEMLYVAYGKASNALTLKTDLAQIQLSNRTLVTLGGLEPGAKYFYRVTAGVDSLLRGGVQSAVNAINTTNLPTATTVKPATVRIGSKVSIIGDALRGSKQGFKVVIAVGCRLEGWPNVRSRCAARSSDILSWKDNKVVFRINKKMRSGPVYLARAYRQSGSWKVLYAVKGPTLTIK